MRCVVSFPGVMEHAQHAARALHEAQALDAFVTAFAYRHAGLIAGLARALSGAHAQRAQREFARRAITQTPDALVKTIPEWEIARTIAAKAGAGPIGVDQIWDVGARAFDRTVARRHVPQTEAIVAFEYTALASFQRARQEGVACVLHLPSLDSLAFKAIQDREQERWPELKSRVDGYFERRFHERYERRRAEIALADVIVANSQLTRRSHIAAGADPAKVFVAGLGAPPPIAEAKPVGSSDAPLTVIWSGPFSLRKGAHYLIEGWRALGAGRAARLRVYGEIGVPRRLIDAAPDGIEFLGSIPRDQLLTAYEAADVLVFPTLSDGFGMSITEALSRGLPVITTDRAGAAELIDHGRNGQVIAAEDPLAIRDALQWCLDNRAAVAAMRSQALETAKRRQWSDYRRDTLAAMDQGLRSAGYAPRFGAV